jgi:hypothetical protein
MRLLAFLDFPICEPYHVTGHASHSQLAQSQQPISPGKPSLAYSDSILRNSLRFGSRRNSFFRPLTTAEQNRFNTQPQWTQKDVRIRLLSPQQFLELAGAAPLLSFGPYWRREHRQRPFFARKKVLRNCSLSNSFVCLPRHPVTAFEFCFCKDRRSTTAFEVIPVECIGAIRAT